jgi:signal transduction histidine kinase
MARELLPPTLEGEGLVPALLELAELHRANGMDVEVHVDELDELSPATATAAYAIASEALRNVVRHATASTCSIRVDDTEDDELVLVVTDDGSGIAADVQPGVGLVSMREWAEGAGGSLELGAVSPRGTRVTARLPVTTVAGVAS